MLGILAQSNQEEPQRLPHTHTHTISTLTSGIHTNCHSLPEFKDQIDVPAVGSVLSSASTLTWRSLWSGVTVYYEAEINDSLKGGNRPEWYMSPTRKINLSPLQLSYGADQL